MGAEGPIQGHVRAQDVSAAPGTGGVLPHIGISHLSTKRPPSHLQAPLGLDDILEERPAGPNSPLPQWLLSCTSCFKLLPGPVSLPSLAHTPPLTGLAMGCPGLFFQQAWAGWKMTSEGGAAREAWGSSEGILGEQAGGLLSGRPAPEDCAQRSQDSVMKGSLPFPASLGDPFLLWLSAAHVWPCTLRADGGLSGRKTEGRLHSHDLDT